jgi:hypothetical protein
MKFGEYKLFRKMMNVNGKEEEMIKKKNKEEKKEDVKNKKLKV